MEDLQILKLQVGMVGEQKSHQRPRSQLSRWADGICLKEKGQDLSSFENRSYTFKPETLMWVRLMLVGSCGQYEYFW